MNHRRQSTSRRDVRRSGRKKIRARQRDVLHGYTGQDAIPNDRWNYRPDTHLSYREDVAYAEESQ